MPCSYDQNLLLEHAYGEIEPAEVEGLTAHLEGCGECRRRLEEISWARRLLREAEPVVPSAPRVVVLARTSMWSLTWAFAAGLACAALLVSVSLRVGWTQSIAEENANIRAGKIPLRQEAAAAFPGAGPDLNEPWRGSVRALIDQSLARERSEIKAWLVNQERRPVVTKEELEAALARLGRRFDGRRASDLDLVLQEISAMEDRTGRRIGQTREALKYVALASDPKISAQ